MKYFPTFFLLLIFSAVSVFPDEPDWFVKLKEVKVFQSSKQDVERVFGNPPIVYSTKNDSREKGWGEINEYQTNEGKLEVFYSTGKCLLST